jgi:hypothetical protein
MDTSALAELASPHKHDAGRRADHAFPVMLVIAFLVLSACAAFAVIMTNGPDYRAAAEPVAPPIVTGGVSTSLGGPDPDKTPETLEFAAAMPEGSVVIGEPGRLVVTISNPHEHPIRLDSLDVTVLEPSRPGCRAEWLSVSEYATDTAPVTIPAKESARITLGYTLVDLVGTNQDACKGATFPLSISGSGRPV